MSIRAIHGDCREVLKTLPDESVHCVVTSPPYYALRDYQTAGQIGLEATPDAFVAELVAVFREVRRVLRSDGTLWLNLGDSYNNVGGGNAFNAPIGSLSGNQRAAHKGVQSVKKWVPGLKPKDLIGVPWMVAFALRADGWYLRQDIIWSKPNPMPESVRDRCCKSHEYLFLLSKNARYYFDQEAIAEDTVFDEVARTTKPYDVPDQRNGINANLGDNLHNKVPRAKRTKRSVWEVATQPFSEAHFATFPPALIEPCIKAGCPARACATCGKPWVREVEKGPLRPVRGKYLGELDNTRKMDGTAEIIYKAGRAMVRTSEGWSLLKRDHITLGFSPSCSCNAATVPGVVLDPFSGAGTTGLVADRLGREAILIELNEDYSGMSRRRIHDDAPLFAEVTA